MTENDAREETGLEVEVRLFSGLEKFFPAAGLGKACLVQVPEGATGSDLIRQLNIPADQVFTMFVNGRHAAPEQVLQPGDRVALFPPIGGG
ncbi:MAG: MoaD/ThiS family protein [Bacillota bacterium]